MKKIRKALSLLLALSLVLSLFTWLTVTTNAENSHGEYISFNAIDAQGTMSNGATIVPVTTQGAASVAYDPATDSYNLVSNAWVKNARALITPQAAIPKNKYRYAKILAKYNNTNNIGYTIDTYAASKWEDALAPTQYVGASDSANWKESVFELGENTADITRLYFFFVWNQAEPATSTVSTTSTLNYLALFENEQDAINYDNSIKEFTFEGSKGEIDKIDHTINLKLPLGCTAASIQGKAPTIELANGASNNFVIPTTYGTDPIDVSITSPAGKEVVYTLNLEFTAIPQDTMDAIIDALKSGDSSQINTCFANNSEICNVMFSGLTDLTEAQKDILFSNLSSSEEYNADNFISLVNKGIYWVKLKTLSTEIVTNGINLIAENDKDFYENSIFAVFRDKLTAAQQENIFDIALSKNTYDEFKQTIIEETADNYQGKYYEIKPIDDNGTLSNGATISAVTTQGAKSVFYNAETDSYVSKSDGYVKNARTSIELESSIPKNTYKYAKILAKYDSDNNIGYTIDTYAGSNWENALAPTQYVSASDSSNWKESVFELGENTADITRLLYFFVWNQEEPADENVEATNRLQYLALFELEEDAKAYDDSIKSFDFGGKAGTINNIKHIVKVELPLGETANSIRGIKPEIDVKSGGSACFTVPENYSDTPVKFTVTNPAGREVEYTLKLVYNPIPDALLQNILTALNSKVKDTIKECFEQKDAEFKEILTSSDNAFQNLNEAQKDVLYTTLSKYNGTYDQYNFKDLIKKAVFWAKLKTETAEKTDDGIERIKAEDEDFYKSDIFALFNNYLPDDVKTNIYDDALSKDTYEEFKTEIAEKTKEKAIFSQDRGQKLKEVFEKYIENGYLPTVFTKDDYQEECDKVKTFDISIVFTDMNERIAKAGNTIGLDAIVGIFKASVSDNVTAFSAKENSNKSLTGGGSSGGGGTVPSVSSVIPAEPLSNFAFRDCDSFRWAKESIKNLYEKGIISGISNDEYAPQNNVTREQFVKLIVSAFEIGHSENNISFKDVDNNAWYYDYICAAVNAGIISGMSENDFGVGRNISREDMAVICLRAMNLKKADIKNDGVNTLHDRDSVADYAQEAVSILYQNGIISGDEKGMFNPKASANRAQAAVIIDKLINFLNR